MTSDSSGPTEALGRQDAEFRQFYADTTPGLITFLRRNYPALDAENVAHEAYIRLLGRWDTVVARRAFLFIVARRLAIDSATKATLHVPMDAVGELVDPCQSDPAFAYEVQETLDAAMELPPAQREVVHLLVAGLSIEEIAEVTGKTMWAVRKALYRGRRSLVRQGLGDPRDRRSSTTAAASATGGDDPGRTAAAHDNDSSDTCGIGVRDE